jgi:phenylalanyl-tRNA synthetase beta chain
MKVTYNWLKEFVHFDLSPRELANKLTLAGPEVAGIKKVGVDKENSSQILLTKVIEVKNHPQSELLKLVSVSAQKNNYSIVSNSKNLEKGHFVVLGLPGTVLPNGQEIKEAVIKDEKSEGMLLAKEHLNLEEKSADIWILGKEEKNALSLFAAYSEEDFILEIELTANRSDCLSVIGIAREISAITGKELHLPKTEIPATIEDIPNIEIRERNSCPRYSARILKKIEIKDSPDWMKKRLELCGIRPINNVVDVTNYVLLEYGHPMHAFDLDKLEGKKIIVRSASAGEHFKTLDGQDHTLSKEMLVIADGKKTVALAGVMGGENSEILDSTKDILLESAYFDPLSIRKTSRKTGIKTESSYRFERTADWGVTVSALERATELLQATCSPQISKIHDEYVNIFKDTIINVKADFISSKIGVDLSLKEIESILKRLLFSILAKREDSLEVKVPTYRSDISKSIDIVEEVARIYGYNNIPQNSFKPAIDITSLSPRKDIQEKLREILPAQGFTEIYQTTFTNEEELKKFLSYGQDVLKLQNPLSNDASLLRNYLFCGLLKTCDYNVKTAYRDNIRLFEIGRTFTKKKDGDSEAQKIGLILYGKDENYYKASGIVEWITKMAGGKNLSYKNAALPFLHPANSALVFLDNTPLGFVGELHPDISQKLDLRYPVYIAELELLPLDQAINQSQEIKPFSKFPPVSRDISLVVDDPVMGRDLMQTIETFHPWIVNARFVDLFQNLQLGVNKKSLTFSITFQNLEKTLNDKEVNDVMEKLIEKLSSQYKAYLRG